jgi:hypothetical protein
MDASNFWHEPNRREWLHRGKENLSVAPSRDSQRRCTIARVTVGRPERRRVDGWTLVSAPIDIGRTHEAQYRVLDGPIAPGAEPFLAGALPVAMKLGLPLHVEEPISAQLLASIPSIQAIYHAWNPDWRVIPVSAESPQPTPPGGGGVASFFSGGVDSFYTLLKHLDEIDALIFIHGFDIPLDNTSLRARVSAAVREVAAAFAKPLIEVETNLKQFVVRHVPWEYAHGALLAGVALLLSPRFSRIYIAASEFYGMAVRVPWGSHPLLDPLWTTERTTIVHDGCEATRMDKVARIARSEVALRWLRVCWENPNGEYNCGRCGKCLRTMVALRIVGALDRCKTFDRPLDLAAVAWKTLSPDRPHMFPYLEAAERAGTDPALVRALRDNVSGRFQRGLWPLAGRLRRWARRGATLAGRCKGNAPPIDSPRP